MFPGLAVRKTLCWKPLIHTTSNLTLHRYHKAISQTGIALQSCSPYQALLQHHSQVSFSFFPPSLGSYSSRASISLILFPLPFLNTNKNLASLWQSVPAAFGTMVFVQTGFPAQPFHVDLRPLWLTPIRSFSGQNTLSRRLSRPGFRSRMISFRSHSLCIYSRTVADSIMPNARCVVGWVARWEGSMQPSCKCTVQMLQEIFSALPCAVIRLHLSTTWLLQVAPSSMHELPRSPQNPPASPAASRWQRHRSQGESGAGESRTVQGRRGGKELPYFSAIFENCLKCRMDWRDASGIPTSSTPPHLTYHCWPYWPKLLQQYHFSLSYESILSYSWIYLTRCNFFSELPHTGRSVQVTALQIKKHFFPSCTPGTLSISHKTQGDIHTVLTGLVDNHTYFELNQLHILRLHILLTHQFTFNIKIKFCSESLEANSK